ncbi:MAG: serine hydrolase [Gammaproteobacteria bacterium]|jgi:hypothetical protein|nr:serine hydrolase [Gammaproteobacteria bacterium]
MGKWSENEEKMKHKVREQIIHALWSKIQKDSPDNFEAKIKNYFILKAVLGLFEEKDKQYIETTKSKRFDIAIKDGNFMAFKEILLEALTQSSHQKLLSERKNESEIMREDIEAESDKKLAEIQNGERLSIPFVDISNPTITPDDIEDLYEYLQEKKISADVSITNLGKTFIINNEKFGTNPVFSIHSVAKVFTGILLMEMMRQNIITADDLDKPIQLSDEVLKELSPAVQEHLTKVTLQQVMIHECGLGDYLDNPSGLSTEIDAKLNAHETPPNITSSFDLLKYGEKEVVGPPGQFRYSNLGILLLGFAIEKKYQDAQRAKLEAPLLEIDAIMHQFVKDKIKLNVFEQKRPHNGQFNQTHQKNPQGIILTDKGSEYVRDYVSARFACTAGGYWTTNEDLQKFGRWIIDECENDSHFKKLIETHGSEFYNAQKQAVEHSGLHADTAHFYASLRNGTVITVLSDQGERAATNLADTILKQTTWYKISLAPQTSTLTDELSSKPIPSLSPAFNHSLNSSPPVVQTPNSDDISLKDEKPFNGKKLD